MNVRANECAIGAPCSRRCVVCACATTTVGFRVLNTPNSTDRVVVSRLSRRRRRRRRRRRAPTHGLLINPRFTHVVVVGRRDRPISISIDRSRPRDRSRYRSIELRRHACVDAYDEGMHTTHPNKYRSVVAYIYARIYYVHQPPSSSSSPSSSSYKKCAHA